MFLSLRGRVANACDAPLRLRILRTFGMLISDYLFGGAAAGVSWGCSSSAAAACSSSSSSSIFNLNFAASCLSEGKNNCFWPLSLSFITIESGSSV